MDDALNRLFSREADEIQQISKACGSQRSETRWLQHKYERFRSRYALSKTECDQFLYEKTFAEPASRSSHAQRIRFWRTGRFYPRNRTVCLSFAKALELSGEETDYLLRAWFDRSDRCFGAGDASDPVYRRRKALMDELTDEFLQKIPPFERKALCAPGTDLRQNLRHIYCVKAAELVDMPMQTFSSLHSFDASYTGQFADEMRLLGDISRSAMLRHLIVLSMPFISTELLNERLDLLGYLPLTEDHSDRSGNPVDAFLLRLLALYERECEGLSPEACTGWLREAIAWFNGFFASHNTPGLCVFRFKHLQNRIAEGTET